MKIIHNSKFLRVLLIKDFFSVDRDSYILLWELLILLLRQKSAIDGCDIAELLLKDRQDFKQPYMADSDSKYMDKNDSKIQESSVNGNADIDSEFDSDVENDNVESSHGATSVKKER